MANRRRPRSRLHAVMRWGLLALLILFVYWDNTALRTDSLTYTSTALPAEFDGLRIVQLSDLHNREFGKNNQRLYAAVKQAAPDLIFLTGDLVDEYAEAPIPYAKAVGKALSAIAPTYYVTGNHEWAHGNAAVEELKTALRESGVTVLSNQFVPLERNGQTIFIAGIDDPNGYADQTTPEELAAKLYAQQEAPFWLLLAHRNTLFNGRYCRLGADLTFCGHAHGGIWRLPFTDGLVDTNLNLLPSFTSGFYHCTDEDCEGAEVFVSRGLGNSPKWAFRLFNRPQVAVITLIANARYLLMSCALAQRFAGETFGTMEMPVLFNCLGREKADADTIPALLVKQVQSSVYMEDTLRRLGELGVDHILEVGPGSALSGFVKKTLPGVPCASVETPEQLDAALAAWRDEA